MYLTNIENQTLLNNYFRQVLYTSPHLQLVLMSLQPGEDIGEEIHKNRDQFFRIEKGNGQIKVLNKTYLIKEGDVVIIPQGTLHNLINTGREPLKLYTIYGPPEHKDKTIHKIKPLRKTR
jgi:mannose-6-phosphate isomerase-like protein (cupin superfamily)